MKDRHIGASYTMGIIESVFFRPKMYTLNGTFAEAVAFLQGHLSGIAKSGPRDEIVKTRNAFEDWLIQVAGVDRPDFWRSIAHSYTTDEEALEAMRGYIERYISEDEDDSVKGL